VTLANPSPSAQQSLSPEEQRLFRLYGKLPSRSDHFAKHLKERKYFDSGDYAMSKAGKGDGVDTGTVGSQHPVPENIPHLSSPVGSAALGPGSPNGLHLHAHHNNVMQAGSPVKESSFLHRETSADEVADEAKAKAGGLQAMVKDGAGPGPQQKAGGPFAPQPQLQQGPKQGQSEAIPIRR
jgi:hypothetical protein